MNNFFFIFSYLTFCKRNNAKILLIIFRFLIIFFLTVILQKKEGYILYIIIYVYIYLYIFIYKKFFPGCVLHI